MQRVCRSFLFGAFFLLTFGIFTFGLAQKAWAATYAVSITSSGFSPSSLQVSVGDSLTFINSTTSTQSAKTTVASGFNTGDIGPGQSKIVTVSSAGTYTYTSLYSPSFTGTVTVLAGDSSSLTSTESATTTTTTSVPDTTQQQPVSGAFENLLALVAIGFGFLGFGWYSRRNTLVENQSGVVDLPLITAKQDSQNYDQSGE